MSSCKTGMYGGSDFFNPYLLSCLSGHENYQYYSILNCMMEKFQRSSLLEFYLKVITKNIWSEGLNLSLITVLIFKSPLHTWCLPNSLLRRSFTHLASWTSLAACNNQTHSKTIPRSKHNPRYVSPEISKRCPTEESRGWETALELPFLKAILRQPKSRYHIIHNQSGLQDLEVFVMLAWG